MRPWLLEPTVQSPRGRAAILSFAALVRAMQRLPKEPRLYFLVLAALPSLATTS